MPSQQESTAVAVAHAHVDAWGVHEQPDLLFWDAFDDPGAGESRARRTTWASARAVPAQLR
jgi:hypothetical protein